MLRLIACSLTFFCFIADIVAQQQEADSLLKILEKGLQKEKKAMVSLQLSKIYERNDLARGKHFAQMALKTSNDSIKSEAYNQLGRTYFYSNQLDSAETYFQHSISTLKMANLDQLISAIRISLGAVQLRKGSYKEAIQTLISSATFFEEQQDSLNMGKCYSNISSAFGELDNHLKAIEYGKKALEIFNSKHIVQYQIITLPNLAGHLVKVGDTLAAKKYFLQAEQLALQIKDQFSLARIYNNLGNIYSKNDYESAEHYFMKALSLREDSKYLDGIGTLYNNLGYLYMSQGTYPKAVPFLEKALEHTDGTARTIILNNLSETQEKLGNHERALAYERLKFALNDSLLKNENQKTISEISTKYEMGKKEKEILNLQNFNLKTDLKWRQNRNLLIAALGLLGITILSGSLFLKNARRKQIIAEQQQEIEHQKVDQLLRDQEMIGLDAMIEGQEKERQRISQDLHDNLGGKLSALKLYVQELEKIDAVLYQKVKELLDDSYDDVRNIAYEKNSRVMVDKGLIPAIKLVANRIMGTKKLNIEVINIDLKRKIKNFIELQLFRIIQELLNNTVKHAQAENIIIQLSEDEEQLNLIFEDDGIGFVPKQIHNGLGFSNIESRLQKINGTFTIDSSPGNGTTIIINVPI